MSASGEPCIEDYGVGSLIGEGAFAKIFFGRHKATRRPVAIKVVSKVRLQKHPRVLRGLLNEQRMLSQSLWSTNCHVITLLASFHDKEFLYFVMECATRGTLAHVMAKREHHCDRIVWNSTVVPHYMLQLVEAIEFIHAQRVIHCDLKPDNVLVTETGILHLTDFASAVELDKDGKAIDSRQLTMLLGTTDFASPETLLGESHPTFAVDLWSLGCMCYALIAEGCSPFHANSDLLATERIQSYMNHSFDIPRVPSDEWNSLVHGLLDVEPALRLGMSNVDQLSTLGRYTVIRSHPALRGAEDTIPHLPPHPAWWIEARKELLRDGKLGWSVFV